MKNGRWKVESEKWKIENTTSLTNLCSGRPSQPDVFFLSVLSFILRVSFADRT